MYWLCHLKKLVLIAMVYAIIICFSKLLECCAKLFLLSVAICVVHIKSVFLKNGLISMKDVEFNFSVLFLFPFYGTENYTGRKETYYSGTLYDKDINKKKQKIPGNNCMF